MNSIVLVIAVVAAVVILLFVVIGVMYSMGSGPDVGPKAIRRRSPTSPDPISDLVEDASAESVDDATPVVPPH